MSFPDDPSSQRSPILSPTTYPSYDYTEGASPREISEVISIREQQRRRRRDSQVGSAYGDDDEGGGAVFGGPSAGVVPSSVSTMHYDRPWASRRRSSDAFSRRTSISLSRRMSGEPSSPRVRRRQSEDAESIALSDNVSEPGDDEDERSSRAHTRRLSRRRTAASPPGSPTTARGLFDNIAGLFGGGGGTSVAGEGTRSKAGSVSRSSRRGSRASSRIGSDRATGDYSDDEERWGYSSAEEDVDEEDRLVADIKSGDDSDFGASRPPSPSTSLPLLVAHSDPFFGDTRIDIDVDLASRPTSPPPPPGPPSRQTIALLDEDITLRFTGCEAIPSRKVLWRIGCVASFGSLALLGHWTPALWLRWVTRERGFKAIEDGFVVIEVCIICTPKSGLESSVNRIDALSRHPSGEDPVLPVPLCYINRIGTVHRPTKQWLSQRESVAERWFTSFLSHFAFGTVGDAQSAGAPVFSIYTRSSDWTLCHSEVSTLTIL